MPFKSCFHSSEGPKDDLNNWENTIFMVEYFNIVNLSFSHKLIYQLNSILT